MKKSLSWVVLLLFVPVLALGQSENRNENLKIRLEEFKKMVEAAAKKMNTEMPVVAMTDEHDEIVPESEVRIYRLPFVNGVDSFKYLIQIEEDFLLQMPDIVLNVSAVHEICHLKLRHLGSDQPADEEKEMEAERCSFAYVGEDEYVEHLIAYSEMSLNSSKALAALGREEVKRRLRKILFPE